jgi:lipoyl-dependent peroxiredoxin
MIGPVILIITLKIKLIDVNIIKILCKTKAISSGGRDGKVRIENSPLEFKMTEPSELGGTGKVGVNPEQLFAAGYAASGAEIR